MKVLVVEDSERLRRALGEGLRRLGFVVDLTGDGDAGLKFALANQYDVIVLDIMLPGMDGLTVLKRLRAEHSASQILILSAKDQVMDRVNGLELGADDYLPKPFEFDELAARIKTLGRRRYEVKNPEVTLGRLTLDTAKRHARVSGRALSFTPAEYNILEHLAFNRGRVISKTRLLDWIHNSDSEAVSNVVEVLVSSLRKKLKQVDIDGLIKTKRGFGYYVE